MNRRNFVKMASALPAAAPALALSIKQPDGPAIETDVAVLRLKPGDVVVVSVPGAIPMAMADRLREQAKMFLPPDVEVMVLSDGLSIGVIRKETA